MLVKRFTDAEPYEVPNHRQYSSLRCFKTGPHGSRAINFGVSHFLPGGGAGPDGSPSEKVYFVIAGELTVIVDGKETVLRRNDSCVIAPNEIREIVNRGNEVCTIAVVVVSVPV
jgi:quercetin dioxygenase-like cupin family protein